MFASLVTKVDKHYDSLSRSTKKCQSCEKQYLSFEVLVVSEGSMPEFIAHTPFKKFTLKGDKVVCAPSFDYYHVCDQCLFFYGFERIVEEPMSMGLYSMFEI